MRRALLTVASLLWIEIWIGTAVAVYKGLAYGFGGQGHTDNVRGDFVGGGGTALSPPLIIVVLFAALIALTTRRGWPGVGGIIGLTLLALLFVFTILGEPLARRVLSPAHLAFPETMLVVLSLLGAVLLFALGVSNLIGMYRVRRTSALGSSRA